ncbi:conserved unknown protein [Ectocarpus siliculosus]|uniref:Pentacotripeptide-repeat region of PRORP domain-containing protein n=1 Tax=Ectocarpus siliculosus TaxID=2880 RepID=D7FK78_ECTSI|nr:conserved unknown protein [Ectocarpus siliculosus]|eukprot:CBJ29283.1 conserved unknown protein [Ectocarpus siliculosus]
MPAEATGNEDVLAARPDLERHGTPAAMLTTRLRRMFASNGNGPWWLAVHLLEKGRQNGIKDVKVYNTVLKMIATDERMTEDKMKEMERLFEQMTEDDELEPEALTYSHLIYGYSQGRKEGEAVRLLEEMTVKGLQPERKTLSSMIVAHSWGSVEDMRRVSSEMREKGWTPTQRANSAMIGALRRAEDWEGILDTTRAMLENGQTMTEAGLVVAIKAAANAGNAGFARELLLTHGKNKHRPQEQLYVCVMVALRNACQHEECLACWRELVLLDGLGDVKLNGKTYNLALTSAVKMERWDEMEAILDMMQAKAVESTVATWRSMVDVWSAEETGDEGRLDRIFGEIHRRQWRPDRAVGLHAAMAYARCRAWVKAMAWFDPALAEDNKLGPNETELLVMSLAGVERYGEVKEVWTRNTGSKDASVFRPAVLLTMAEAARELDDADWALELHSVASSRRGAGVAAPRLWQDVVGVLTKAGRLEEAADVLQQTRPGDCAPLETPVTRETILSAFSDLAHPAVVSAFVEELRAAGYEPDAAHLASLGLEKAPPAGPEEGAPPFAAEGGGS